MSFSFSKEFSEFLNQGFMLTSLGVGPGPSQVVVGEVGDDASLASLLVFAGVVLATLYRGGPLTVGSLPSVSL